MIRKYLFLLFVYNFSFCSVIAQHSISIRSGLNIGSNAKNQYLSPNLKISNNYAIPQLVVPLKIQYRFLNFFGIDAGYQWSLQSISAINPRYRRLPSAKHATVDDSTNIVLQGKKLYQSLSIAAYGYIPLGWNRDDDELAMSLYFGAGLLFSKRIGSAFSHDSYLYQPDNFLLDYNTQYINRTRASYVEFGLNYDGGKSDKKKLIFFAGIKYFYNSPTIMTGNYNVFSNNQIRDHDELRSNYGHIMFTFELGRNILYKPKKLSQLIPVKLHFPTYDKVLHDSLHAQKVKNDSLVIVRKQAEQNAALETMGNRLVQTTHVLNVHTPTLIIKVWDKQIVDGDIVSLNLNGKWILENFSLTAHKKEIEITLNPGENNLVLYAISEGRRRSCTVAVIFDDGHKQEQLLLDSDLKKSSAVQINYVP